MKQPAGEVEILSTILPARRQCQNRCPRGKSPRCYLQEIHRDVTRGVQLHAVQGLKVGDFAELIQAGGLEMPLVEGKHKAELWIGKNRRDFTIHRSRSPVATIAIFPPPPQDPWPPQTSKIDDLLSFFCFHFQSGPDLDPFNARLLPRT